MASTQLSGVPFYAVWVQNLLLHFRPRNNIRVGDEKEEDVMYQVESFSFWTVNHIWEAHRLFSQFKVFSVTQLIKFCIYLQYTNLH